jgi:hypothetical protein
LVQTDEAKYVFKELEVVNTDEAADVCATTGEAAVGEVDTFASTIRTQRPS